MAAKTPFGGGAGGAAPATAQQPSEHPHFRPLGPSPQHHSSQHSAAATGQMPRKLLDLNLAPSLRDCWSCDPVPHAGESGLHLSIVVLGASGDLAKKVRARWLVTKRELLSRERGAHEPCSHPFLATRAPQKTFPALFALHSKG